MLKIIKVFAMSIMVRINALILNIEARNPNIPVDVINTFLNLWLEISRYS